MKFRRPQALWFGRRRRAKLMAVAEAADTECVFFFNGRLLV